MLRFQASRIESQILFVIDSIAIFARLLSRVSTKLDKNILSSLVDNIT